MLSVLLSVEEDNSRQKWPGILKLFLTGYTLFRNDNQPTALNTRPYGGTAVYSKNPFILGYRVYKNTNGVEITVIRLVTIPHVTIIGVYRSPKVPVSQMCLALMQILTLYPDYCIFILGFHMTSSK